MWTLIYRPIYNYVSNICQFVKVQTLDICVATCNCCYIMCLDRLENLLICPFTVLSSLYFLIHLTLLSKLSHRPSVYLYIYFIYLSLSDNTYRKLYFPCTIHFNFLTYYIKKKILFYVDTYYVY